MLDHRFPRLRVKKVRLDVRASVKWKRIYRKEGNEASCSHDGGNGLGGNSSSSSSSGSTGEDDMKVRYSSRKLLCTQCGAPKETAKMQLYTTRGFRDLHCGICGRHARCGKMACTCGPIWHRCLLHRIDPGIHKSTKAARGVKEDHIPLQLPHSRAAPFMVRKGAKKRAHMVRASQSRHEYGKGVEINETRIFANSPRKEHENTIQPQLNASALGSSHA